MLCLDHFSFEMLAQSFFRTWAWALAPGISLVSGHYLQRQTPPKSNLSLVVSHQNVNTYTHLSFISTEHLQEVPPATLQQREEVAGTYAQLAHHQAGQVQVHVHSQCSVFTFDTVCNATYTDTKSTIFQNQLTKVAVNRDTILYYKCFQYSYRYNVLNNAHGIYTSNYEFNWGFNRTQPYHTEIGCQRPQAPYMQQLNLGFVVDLVYLSLQVWTQVVA